MKTIEVVAAIIHRDGEYFATQRGYGNYKGMWEFPGGKIEMGESPEQALHREILEELGIHINIDSLLCTTHYDYPEFHLTMHSYICSIASGTITLHEHMDAQWLTKDNISSLNWLPADVEVINRIQSLD